MTETTNRGIHWEGTSPSGVKIEGFLNKKGTRAFPIFVYPVEINSQKMYRVILQKK